MAASRSVPVPEARTPRRGSFAPASSVGAASMGTLRGGTPCLEHYPLQAGDDP